MTECCEVPALLYYHTAPLITVFSHAWGQPITWPGRTGKAACSEVIVAFHALLLQELYVMLLLCMVKLADWSASAPCSMCWLKGQKHRMFPQTIHCANGILTVQGARQVVQPPNILPDT